MCTNQRYIYNPYNHRKVLVKCGMCEACLQEKACARSNRIRNNIYDGEIALFITLTYKNEFIPYIRKSELYSNCPFVNIYRDGDTRLVYSPKIGLRSRYNFVRRHINTVYVPFEMRSHSSYYDDIACLPSIRNYDSDKVSVIQYSDFQKFIKRLRQILIRNFHYEKKFNFFVCAEYGSRFKRAHFHALIYIPSDDEQIFRRAISQAWPYADSRRTQDYIEIARNAAAYVSSYVNCGDDLPALLSLPEFKPQHHMSKGFGIGLVCFSLPKILEKIDRRDLHYYSRKAFDGETATLALPIPKYVLNRYFPFHKGFGRLTSSQLFGILYDPTRSSSLNEYVLGNYLYTYTPLETYKIYVSLENAFQRFHSITNLNRFDYVLYYLEAWKMSALTSIKDSLCSVENFDDWSNFYTNSLDVLFDPSISELDADILELNPNQLSDVLQKTEQFKDLYFKLDKSKRVVNHVMTELGHLV